MGHGQSSRSGQAGGVVIFGGLLGKGRLAALEVRSGAERWGLNVADTASAAIVDGERDVLVAGFFRQESSRSEPELVEPRRTDVHCGSARARKAGRTANSARVQPAG